MPTARFLPFLRPAEESALRAIREDGVRQVEALVARMKGLSEGPALEALDRQAVAIKRQTEVDFLRTKAMYARARGDLAGAQSLDAAVARILNPPGRIATGPDVAKPSVANGGPR
jgi:hypothetical protein